MAIQKIIVRIYDEVCANCCPLIVALLNGSAAAVKFLIIIYA